MPRKRKQRTAEDEALGLRVSALIDERISALLESKATAERIRDEACGCLPKAIVQRIDHCITYKRALSYRDGIIIQAAYGLVQGGGDLCERRDGGRGVAERLGSRLIASHVPARPDVYQNIGKNTENLCRGNVPEFDEILHWGSSADQDQLQALFDYTCARVILLARPVMPMPDLDVPRLTFYRVGALLDELLATPSAGAHEQFAIAAFLGTLVEEFSAAGLVGLRVDTKNLNASDASSGTAGDVEIRHGLSWTV